MYPASFFPCCLTVAVSKMVNKRFPILFQFIPSNNEAKKHHQIVMCCLTVAVIDKHFLLF